MTEDSSAPTHSSLLADGLKASIHLLPAIFITAPVVEHPQQLLLSSVTLDNDSCLRLDEDGYQLHRLAPIEFNSISDYSLQFHQIGEIDSAEHELKHE